MTIATLLRRDLSCCKLRFSPLLLLLLLHAFCPTKAVSQEQEIRFADSTALHSPPWEGTLSLFELTKEGLRINDPAPKNTYNQARLAVAYNSAPTLSWGGSIYFDFKPTRQNCIDFLLYPLTSGKDNQGKEFTDYIVLSVGGAQTVALQTVRAVRNSETGNLSLVGRQNILADGDNTAFRNAENRLDFTVCFERATQEWTLYVDTHNSYIGRGFRLVGKEQYSGQYDFLEQQQLKHILCVTYSKKNASALTVTSLGFYQHLRDPRGSESSEESIISDLSYDGAALILLCNAIPDIATASFTLSPSAHDFNAELLESKIVLPLKKPLEEGRYMLSCEGIKYPDGRESPAEQFTFTIGEVPDDPDIPVPNDNEAKPIISELMPYPDPAGAEYIELYNPTPETIDLRHFGFMLRKEGHAGKMVPIATKNYYLGPSQYMAVTPWGDALVEKFGTPRENIAEVEKFPSLPNTEGQLLLMRLVDSLQVEIVAYRYADYKPKNKKRGYALERRSFERSAEESDNWYAASERVGYGTPGKQNSLAESVLPETKANKRRLTPVDAAQMILSAERVEGSKVRLSFYTVGGLVLERWHYSRCLEWAHALHRGEEPVKFPKSPNGLLVLLEIRYGNQDKPKAYGFVLP